MIDGLVKAIFVYDDYIKLILTFDDKPINIPTSDEIENMANSSDIQSNVSPKRKETPCGVSFRFDDSLWESRPGGTTPFGILRRGARERPWANAVRPYEVSESFTAGDSSVQGTFPSLMIAKNRQRP